MFLASYYTRLKDNLTDLGATPTWMQEVPVIMTVMRNYVLVQVSRLPRLHVQPYHCHSMLWLLLKMLRLLNLSHIDYRSKVPSKKKREGELVKRWNGPLNIAFRKLRSCPAGKNCLWKTTNAISPFICKVNRPFNITEGWKFQMPVKTNCCFVVSS